MTCWRPASPPEHKDTSTALAVDWTDVETFSRPPRRGSSECADPEASWGHRNSNLPGPKGELFFGYYLSAATMAREEQGPAVPELARRMTLTSCRHDPARALVPVLTRMPGHGITLGDILADSGYAHRDAAAWAIPLRAAGAQLIQDLHPHDRGPRGTHAGAIIANGNLYCPATPRPLLELGPLPRDATPEDTTAHDTQAGELARHKLGKITADDADGYHRVTCPAAMGKIRCPLRPGSMTRDRNRPEILTPPEHPPACCTQQTITVPPEVAAKTRQKHDYPSPAHRRSYARRTGSERTFLHHQGHRHQQHRPRLVPPHRPAPRSHLWLACLLTIRNQRILQRLGRPPGREHPPRRRRAPAQNRETPAENHPRQPHRTVITRPAQRATARRSPERRPPAPHAQARPASPPQAPTGPRRTGKPRSTQAMRPGHRNVRPKREHGPTET